MSLRTTVVCAAALALAPPSAWAATLVGVVSERSAPEMAAAAQTFFDRHPGHGLILRTPRQLDRLEPSAVAALLRQADAILISGIFRDEADRLLELRLFLLEEAAP